MRIECWALQRAGALKPGTITRLSIEGRDVGCLRAEPGSRIGPPPSAGGGVLLHDLKVAQPLL